MTTGTLLGIASDSKARVRCTICGVYIPKAKKCINEHINGSRHKEIKEEMTENGIKFLNKNVYCMPCDEILPEEISVVEHIYNMQHEDRMETMSQFTEDESDSSFIHDYNYVNCEVCFCKVDFSICSLKAHVKSPDHCINVKEKLRLSKGIFDSGNDELWCKVCQMYLDKSHDSVIDHIADDNHDHYFRLLEELIYGQEICIASFLENELEQFAYCIKCDQKIICELKSIEMHIKSQIHREM